MIIKNACRCKKCGTYLESKHVHDFRRCKCGVFVDGGKFYIRRGWPDGDPKDWIEELSQETDDFQK